MIWGVCLALAVITLAVRDHQKAKGITSGLTKLSGLIVCIVVAGIAAYNMGYDFTPLEFQQVYRSMWQLVSSLAGLSCAGYMLIQRSSCNPAYLKGWVISLCVDLILIFGTLGVTAGMSLVDALKIF